LSSASSGSKKTEHRFWIAEIFCHELV